jgi:hypothetical protein
MRYSTGDGMFISRLEVAPVGAVAKLGAAFGVAVQRHAGVSSRSCGNSLQVDR